MNNLSVALISSECVPFVKTGGMADVIQALAKELAGSGVRTAVFLPYYRKIRESFEVRDLNLRTSIRIGTQYKEASFLETRLPGTEVPVYLVRNDLYFNRNDLYGEKGIDYPDNLERFLLFNKAVLNFILLTEMKVDLIHCNDWQTALLPAFIRLVYYEALLKKIKVLLTIHNLSYQGLFPLNEYSKLNLSWEYFTYDKFEYYSEMNLLKAGIVFSDAISTVSRTYKEELLADESVSQGLTQVLRSRANRFYGILNGVDYSLWHPENYSAEDLEGKRKFKIDLLNKAGLGSEKKPLLVMVSRLVDMKGFDILIPVLNEILKEDVNLMILGQGDPVIEKALLKVEKANKNFKLYLEFNEKLARQMQSGGDIFLMPSRVEPCGLNQLYALRYGTVPLVHRTGGLADTVTDIQKEKVNGTGFVFYQYHPSALLETIRKALLLFQNKQEWARVQANGMKQDFSWGKSSKEYLELYHKICV
ncbi:MAG: glycogen/starch synthase [bacterium]|nr:glycogen/starch synthase [bacterium]